MTLLIRKEPTGETSEPEIDPVNCVSKGAFALILWSDWIYSQRQADVTQGVPACPRSYHSMTFIISRKSLSGDTIFVEIDMTLTLESF